MGKKTEYVNVGAKNVTISGGIKSEVDIAIASTVFGDVVCSKKVLIDDQSYIEGNITSTDVTVLNGAVNGNITCTGSVIICTKGSVEGNIKCKSIVIDEGAFFDGECVMGQISGEDIDMEDCLEET